MPRKTKQIMVTVPVEVALEMTTAAKKLGISYTAFTVLSWRMYIDSLKPKSVVRKITMKKDEPEELDEERRLTEAGWDGPESY